MRHRFAALLVMTMASTGSGVHFGASEPRHDGAAMPEAPEVFQR